MNLRIRFNQALANARLQGAFLLLRFHFAPPLPPPHDAACNAQHQRAEAQRWTYRTKWPHHCKSCNGYGGKAYSYDPSPPGISLGPGTMLDFEPCPTCWAKWTCPRCALPHAFDETSSDETPCRRCGWLQQDASDPHGLDPGLPEEWSCWGACDVEAEPLETGVIWP